MKNLVFGIIATFLFSILGFSQSAKLIDAKGTEIAIVINFNENNSFKEYYLLQYENVDFSDLCKETEITILEVNSSRIKLKKNDVIFTLTIDSNYKNENEKVYLGYGLSKRSGNFSLIKDNLNPTSINEIILVNGIAFRGGNTCHSGGVGSSQCSVTPSNVSVGTSSCTVTCSAGYHSCCDDTKGECNCIKDKKKVNIVKTVE